MTSFQSGLGEEFCSQNSHAHSLFFSLTHKSSIEVDLLMSNPIRNFGSRGTTMVSNLFVLTKEYNLMLFCRQLAALPLLVVLL